MAFLKRMQLLHQEPLVGSLNSKQDLFFDLEYKST